MAHPNEDLLRRGYDAFAKGDMETVAETMADTHTYHVPGRGPLSGDYEGREATLGFFAKLFEMTGGTFTLEVHDVVASDDHVVVLQVSRAQREGKSPLEDRAVNVFHVEGGKVTESWFHPGDQYASDEFFS